MAGPEFRQELPERDPQHEAFVAIVRLRAASRGVVPARTTNLAMPGYWAGECGVSLKRLNGVMQVQKPIRVSLARVVRTYRAKLGYTQAQVGEAVGVHRGYIAAIESGRANPSVGVVERLATVLGLVVEMEFHPPSVFGPRDEVDALHSRCLGQVERRLRASGVETAREVEIVHARSHGWIDLLAFDPRTGILLIIEVKTWLDDLGAVERQLGWYERSAFAAAGRLGWTAQRSMPWLLVLATTAADKFVREHRSTLAINFPTRAREMMSIAAGHPPAGQLGRGLAFIDPASHRAEWLMRSTADGRRSSAPYLDPRHARQVLGI